MSREMAERKEVRLTDSYGAPAKTGVGQRLDLPPASRTSANGGASATAFECTPVAAGSACWGYLERVHSPQGTAAGLFSRLSEELVGDQADWPARSRWGGRG